MAAPDLAKFTIRNCVLHVCAKLGKEKKIILSREQKARCRELNYSDAEGLSRGENFV
jgi:hypothetical protein